MLAGENRPALKCFLKMIDIVKSSPYMRALSPEILSHLGFHCSMAVDSEKQQSMWLKRSSKVVDSHGPVTALAVAKLTRFYLIMKLAGHAY